MPEDGSVVGSRQVRTWSIVDFVLVWLGGFLGAGVFLVIGQTTGTEDWLIVLGLAGRYVGNIVVFFYLARQKDDGGVGFAIETSDFAYIGLGLFLQLMVALVTAPLVDLFFPDGRSPQQIAEAMSDADASTFIKIAFFTAAVVLAPITEELMFRGVLLKALVRRSRVFVIVMTATVFAAFHVVGLDLDRPFASAVVVLPPVFLLGLLLAWLTLRKQRLGPAIFLHSGWNLLAAIVLLVPSEVLESVS